MKTEARLFVGVAVFLWIVGIGYAWWTSYPNSFSHGNVEWAGTLALFLSGGLCGLAGSFFWFVSRRIDLRPEDRGDAEVAEGAGELGFFSPGSYWPVGLAAAATVLGTGLAFFQWWLVIIGVLVLVFMVGGLVFEYYIGGRHPIGE